MAEAGTRPRSMSLPLLLEGAACDRPAKEAEAEAPEAAFEDLQLAVPATPNEMAEISEPWELQRCAVYCRPLGIEVCGPAQQFFIPWEAAPQLMEGPETSPARSSSHPHAIVLLARFSFSSRSNCSVEFHLAGKDPKTLEILQEVTQKQQFIREALSVPSSCSSEEAVAIELSSGEVPRERDTECPPISLSHREILYLGEAAKMTQSRLQTPRAPPRMQQDFLSPVASPPPAFGMELSRDVLSVLTTEVNVPIPLSLEHAWLHLPPSCPRFHRCTVSVDKLGLVVQPLSKSCKRFRAAQRHVTGLYVLPTESLGFPLSAILDIDQAPDFADSLLSMAARASEAPGRPADPVGAGLRRCYAPLARRIFHRRITSKEGQEGQAQGSLPDLEQAERPPPEASTFVAVTLRASVAGKPAGQERLPPYMRLHGDTRPPIKMYLALYKEDEALALISSVLAFKSLLGHKNSQV
ncbi:unnamed protein product [Symbiodinium microadriaticum]|nr:unnamed protein product [Symbiodinium microadriaticum]